MIRLFLANIAFFGLLCLLPSPADALDVRIALLIGNEQGWKHDAKLRYVIKGDLHPLARTLRGIGFQVLTLANPTPATVRQAFRKLYERLQQSPKVTTFLFYYTGHADQHYFHMGPKTGSLFSYGEFRRLFYGLQIKRRIGIIDACHSGEIVKRFGSEQRFRMVSQRGMSKGVRAQRTTNLIQRLKPSEGNERGLRVIGSSRFLSWEIRKYKASVFTHHLLRGLRGQADLNKDGRISLDELFDYTRQNVFRDTGQRPQQYKQVIIGEPYAFAPAYKSRLRISANVVGQLKIAVANFIWYKNKRTRDAMKLAIVAGKGHAYLRRARGCFRQPVVLPKGGEGTLNNQRWLRIACQRMAWLPKGSVVLHAQTSIRKQTQHDLTLGLSGGYAYYGEETLQGHNVTTNLDLRYRFLGGGLSFFHGTPSNKTFALNRYLLRLDLGYPLYHKAFDFFLGIYVQGGLTTQLPQDGSVKGAFSFGSGGTIDASFWLTPTLGLRLGARAGFDYTPVTKSTSIAFFGQAYLSVLFSLMQTQAVYEG